MPKKPDQLFYEITWDEYEWVKTSMRWGKRLAPR